MNFGLQYRVPILCISKHSIRNICVSSEVNCIWMKWPNMALRDDITLIMIYDIIKLIKENGKELLGCSRAMRWPAIEGLIAIIFTPRIYEQKLNYK